METNQIEKNSTSSIRFLRWPEVQHRVGFSKSYAYALQAKGKFPKPIKLIEEVEVALPATLNQK